MRTRVTDNNCCLHSIATMVSLTQTTSYVVDSRPISYKIIVAVRSVGVNRSTVRKDLCGVQVACIPVIFRQNIDTVAVELEGYWNSLKYET